MTSTLITIEFEDSHPCVSWRGYSFSDGIEFDHFLQTEVCERFDDQTEKLDFRDHLNGLDLTEMGKENLQSVLNAEVPEQREWAAGEALAEAFLVQKKEVILPWNMARDKRNSFASLPGPDIIGFVPANNGGHCFAFGEVKTSSDKKTPPGIMSSLTSQIDRLAFNVTTINQILQWLYSRVKREHYHEYQEVFDSCCKSYFSSNRKLVALFGILIRDTKPDEHDLVSGGKKLRAKLSPPTQCDLIALYLPWKKSQLVQTIRQVSSL